MIGENDDTVLPEGWARIRLGGFVYLAGRIGWRGLKAEEYTESGPLLLSVHGLNNGEHVTYDDAKHISENRYRESPEIMLREDDILLAKDGAGIGKLGIVVGLPSEATVNSSLLVVRVVDGLLPKYLFYNLAGPKMQELAKARITGSATPHLFQKDIKTFEVAVPPLAEQKRIVAKVETLLARVNAARQRLAKAPSLLKRFRQSVLAAACSGQITEDWREENPITESSSDLIRRIETDRAANRKTQKKIIDDETDQATHEIPTSWSWSNLSAIGQEGRPIIYGIIKPGPHDPEGVPYVRVTEMKDGFVDLPNLRRASKERADKFKRATLASGDLLISKDGTIGCVAVVPPELEGGNITQHLDDHFTNRCAAAIGLDKAGRLRQAGESPGSLGQGCPSCQTPLRRRLSWTSKHKIACRLSLEPTPRRKPWSFAVG